ncbi:MAG: RnfABCDGE type electron transport complex subunit D [Spirochaetaceae bacterium]|jgi:electron transport complex protein RnfD|nr:RnfABCDGE type electron transport complex subunit D [Spirochaetaceae bacterium]
MATQNTRLYKPQINLSNPTAARMWLVSLCAALAVLQSSLSDSFASLIVAFSAVVAAIVTESLIYFRTERSGTIKDGSAVTSALVLTLLLPNQIHPVYAALGAAFAMTVVKHSFGGLGANWMNPALGGWLFIRFSWPEVFHKALEKSPLALLLEGMKQGLEDPEGSPLGILKLIEAAREAPQDPFLNGLLSSFLNGGLFSFTALEFPESYIELFNASAPGIIADRGILALLLGTVILTAAQTRRSWVPAAYLGVYLLLVRIFGAIPFGGSLGQGDLLFGLFSGGVLAAAFLLISEPATGPKSNRGILGAAVLGGALAFLFRYRGLETYGAFAALGLINALVPVIRDLESRLLYKDGVLCYERNERNEKNEYKKA